MHRLLAVLAVAASTAVAHAEPGVPAFTTLDRGDDATIVRVDLSAARYHGSLSDVSTLRLDLYGQSLTTNGYGVYAQMPVAWVLGDSSRPGVGGLELGGLCDVRGSLPVTLRAGITFPLDEAGSLASQIGGFGRTADLVADLHGTTWLRLAASPRLMRGSYFARLDGGLDVPISQLGRPFGRVNAGVGRWIGKVAAMGELVTLFTTRGGYDFRDRFILSAAIGARYDAGKVDPSIAVVTPLNEENRAEAPITIVVGMQAVGF